MTFEDHIKKSDMTGDQKASLHKSRAWAAYTQTHAGKIPLTLPRDPLFFLFHDN